MIGGQRWEGLVMMAMIGAREQLLATAHNRWSHCQHPCGSDLPRTAHRSGDGYFVANSSYNSFWTPPKNDHDVSTCHVRARHFWTTSVNFQPVPIINLDFLPSHTAPRRGLTSFNCHQVPSQASSAQARGGVQPSFSRCAG
jgi:hypothetical protein